MEEEGSGNMEKTQCYVGTPNGVILCVDQLEEENFSGRIYHAYSREAKDFRNIDEMVFLVEQLYDGLNFPHQTADSRTFTGIRQQAPVKERTKIMKEEELLSKHGDLGTFIIRVQHRQNSSWQGRITWMEKNKTVYFRSIWEMIKLVAGALDTVSEEEDGVAELHWEDEEK